MSDLKIRSEIRKVRKGSSPRELVGFYFDQMSQAVHNMFVKDSLWKNENIQSTTNPSKIRERGDFIIDKIAENKDVCMAMAADVTPEASRMFIMSARLEDGDSEIFNNLDRMVRAESSEDARDIYCTYLRESVRTGEIEEARYEITTHQIPPEDAVSEGVLKW